jgi:ATP-dependent Lhr-like helicase
VASFLAQNGASFFDEIAGGTGLLKSQAEEALGELVALGLAVADSYSGLRALLLPASRRSGYRGRRRHLAEYGLEEAGRWAGIQRQTEGAGGQLPPEHIETLAVTLLQRYGVIFKRLLAREAGWLPSWYELLRVYRRLEARGEIRGGRFVAGPTGEQYALPEVVSALRTTRKRPKDGQLIAVSAADPLNLTGTLLPGERVPSLAGNRVLFRDGVPVAVQVAGETHFLAQCEPGEEWALRSALIRQTVAPGVRQYVN